MVRESVGLFTLIRVAYSCGTSRLVPLGRPRIPLLQQIRSYRRARRRRADLEVHGTERIGVLGFPVQVYLDVWDAVRGDRRSRRNIEEAFAAGGQRLRWRGTSMLGRSISLGASSDTISSR